MDFIKKISDIINKLLPSKKDKDDINVPLTPPTQNLSDETPVGETEPIKQDFSIPEEVAGGEAEAGTEAPEATEATEAPEAPEAPEAGEEGGEEGKVM